MKTDEEIYWKYREVSEDSRIACSAARHTAACHAVAEWLEKEEKADRVAQAVGRYTEFLMRKR